MDFRSKKLIAGRVLLTLSALLSFYSADAQQTSLNPVSYWIFTPYIYNPAMVGSKDFLTLDCNAAFQGKSNTQIISGNTRLSKTKPGYFSSPKFKEFKSIGIGGSLFNDENGIHHDLGVSAAGSYMIPLNTKELSFISIGASAKGIYNIIDSSLVESGSPSKKSFHPNVDIGIYYFGTNFYTGLSSVNLLGNPGDPDSLGNFELPISRQYFFTAGYKFLIYKNLNIVIEPSVLIHVDDSTLSNIEKHITPILKLYIDNFCLGSYFLNEGNTSFFFQYRYPRFYLGAFYDLPRKTAYYKRTPTVEFTLGINFQVDKSRFSRRSHW